MGQVDVELTAVAGTCGTNTVGTPGTLSVAEVAEGDELDQHPFWSLLRAAGYKEW